MLQSVGPSVARGRDTTLLKEVLDKTAERVGGDLKGQPEVEVELRNTIGQVYYELGDYEAAEAMHRQALEIARTHRRASAQEMATSLHYLARAILEHERFGLREPERFLQAEVSEREAVALRKGILRGKSPDVAVSLDTLARILNEQGKSAEAELAEREALAIQKEAGRDETREGTEALNNLGVVLNYEGKLAEAELVLRQALAIRKALFGSEDPDVADSYSNLGFVLRREGKLAEAEPFCREGLMMRRKLLGIGHSVTLEALHFLTGVLEDEGKLADAEPFYREWVTNAAKMWPSDPGKWQWQVADLALVLDKQGKLAEAEFFRQAVTTAAELWPHDSPRQSSALVALLQGQKKTDDVERLRQELTSIAEGANNARAGHWTNAIAVFSKLVELEPTNHLHYHRLAPLLVQSGDLDAYHRHCAQVLELFAGATNLNVAERMAKDCLIVPDPGIDLKAVARLADVAVTRGKEHPDFVYFEFAKGLAEYRQGHFAVAIEWTQKVLNEPGAPFRTAQAYLVLAMAQHASGRPADAVAALNKGAQVIDTQMPKLETGDIGKNWTDWIIAHALLKEAKGLIEGNKPHSQQTSGAEHSGPVNYTSQSQSLSLATGVQAN